MLKFVLLWASITFPHQEYHNYANFHVALLAHDGIALQEGRLIVPLGWGWLGMMPWNNVAMPIMTVVGASGENPPNAA